MLCFFDGPLLYDLFRQVVGITMDTNCVRPVADVLVCYGRDLMMSLSDDNKADIIDPLILHQYSLMIF